MPRKPSKTLAEQICEAKLKVLKVQEAYFTQWYFETMPEYDPMYSYSYQHSNFTITGYEQNIDDWLRAVIKHMGLRHRGHGGAKTNALLVSIPTNLDEIGIDVWIDDVTKELRKRALGRAKKDA